MSDPISEAEAANYPGAQAPDRTRTVLSHGLRLAVHEWGDPEALPIVMAHGGFDFGRTLDVFAPMLVEGGYRVVTWDQRGHGDSEHSPLYSWSADVRDLLSVINTVSREPVPVIGHSKGGTLMMSLAIARPHRVAAMVNIDGIPWGGRLPDVTDTQRSEMLRQALDDWLKHRRRLTDYQRRPGTIEELAHRRSKMNGRLSPEWLRYLVTVGARQDGDSWRWKIDPQLRMGGFGPNRPEWWVNFLPSISAPFLGILAGQPDELGWPTKPEDIKRYLPPWASAIQVEDAGHFIHIEKPRLVADTVLEFFDREVER